jgi:hypothetical protein
VRRAGQMGHQLAEASRSLPASAREAVEKIVIRQ